MPDVKPPRPAEPWDHGVGASTGMGPFNSLGYLLSQIGYMAAKRFHTTMASLDMEPRHFFVLRVVAFQEGLSQQSLGEMLHIPASRMVAIVDALESAGLVERRPGPGDRRVRALHVTDAGREALQRAMGMAMHHESTVGTTLTPEERHQLVALLQKLAAEMGLLGGAHPALREDDDAEPD